MNSIYNWDAAEYEKHSSQQQLWAQDVIRSQKLEGDERILDIGCGDGKVTAELVALVPKGCVLGIDLSESMVAFAHRRFPPVHYLNLQFRWGMLPALLIVASLTQSCRSQAYTGYAIIL